MIKILLRWLLALMLLPGFVYAQALPASTMQRAVAAVMEKKMAARGFASNDPRWAATLQSSGSQVVGAVVAAAAVTAAGITAPAWLTVAGTVALGALLGYGIDLAVDGIKWMINGDGSVTYSPPGSSGGSSPPESGGAMTSGGAYYNQGEVYGGSGANVSKEHTTLTYPGMTFVGGHYDESGNFWYWVDDPGSAGGHCAPYPHCNGMMTLKQNSGAPANCGAGMVYVGSCRALTPTGSSAPATPVTKSPTDAVAALSETDKATPLNPEVIAKIADAIWRKAASQPGYVGVPYDATNPITTSDAAAIQQSNPQNWPTVGDATAPQQAPAGQAASQPWTLPNSAAEPVVNPGTTPAQPTPASGLDWAIPGTSETIERKVFQINYSPVGFKVASGCPAPIEYRMFEQNYQLAYGPFCDLMEYLYPLFIAMGAISAAFIFANSLKS